MPSRGSSCRHRTGSREAVALPRPRASRVGLPARTPSLPLAAQDAPQASPVRLRRVLVPASGRLGGVRDRGSVRVDPCVLPQNHEKSWLNRKNATWTLTGHIWRGHIFNMNAAMNLPPLPTETPGPRAELRDPADTIRFLLAGNAHVTFQSKRTGTRFTYRVVGNSKSEGPSHFVHVLTGPDEYAYLGVIWDSRAYAHGRKSRIFSSAKSNVAFSWCWSRLSAGKMPADLEIWHEGRCGKCGRRLTDPESISSGLGPVCAKRGAL